MVKRTVRLAFRAARTCAALGLLAAGVVIGVHFYEISARWESTENAYVKSHLVAISPDVDGRVAEVFVSDNQWVAEGEALFELDREPFVLALAEAEAQLDRARQEVESLRSRYRLALIEVGRAEERVRYLDLERRRQARLSEDGSGAKAQLDAAKYEFAISRHEVEIHRENARTMLVELGGFLNSSTDRHPIFLRAKAARDRAERELRRTRVVAPASGFVTNIQLERGEFVEAGHPTFTLVSAERTWIIANLKESQLTHVEAGQVAEVAVDAYPGRRLAARVTSISPATGAEFALLPPQNASGNWVKVVQRIPVRLEVLPDQDNVPALRAGMTASVSIDTRRTRPLPALARGVRDLGLELGFEAVASTLENELR